MGELTVFKKNPLENQHEAYDNSFFVFPRAPEYATGEVVLASLYRAVGFKDVSEKDVPKNGRQFYKQVNNVGQPVTSNTTLSIESWKEVVNEILESPKRPRQSSSRFLQLTPLTPKINKFTSSARMKGNPWTPGQLIRGMMDFSGRSEQDLEHIWDSLYETLSVESDDDIWAQLIERELSAWDTSQDSKWEKIPYGEPEFTGEEKGIPRNPSSQFVEDIETLVKLKKHLSRRQWTSIFESLLRLGSSSFTFWVCYLHSQIWEAMNQALKSQFEKDKSNFYETLSTPNEGFLEIEEYTSQKINKFSRNYFSARIGINLVFTYLDEHDLYDVPQAFNGVEDLYNWIKGLDSKSPNINYQEINLQHKQILEKYTRHLKCKKGIPNNLKEFLTYCLSKRQTSNEELKNYDQGYFVNKSTENKRSPWIVSLGPVAVLLLVHCCTAGKNYPQTLVDLCTHMEQYGLTTVPDQVPFNSLGDTLRNLNLVLDSPDAEGGMVLVPPFRVNN